MRTILINATIFLTVVSNIFSQEKSIVEIVSEKGEHPMGRATVVEKRGDVGIAITAFHVIDNNPAISINNFKIKDRDGVIKKGAKFLKAKIDVDLALIEIPLTDGIEIAEIGELVENDILVFDINWNQHNPKLSLKQSKFFYYDYSPFSGESGGPVFSNGKLISVVSGGWFWIEKDVFETVNKRQTWPLRATRIPKDFLN
jgi:hypothetical protein